MEKYSNKENIFTDLTFFTNEPGSTLLDRFQKTLKHTRFFDVLVGYFRTSGFYLLYDALESTEKIRMLVGLKVDQTAYEAIQVAKSQQAFDFESHKRVKENYKKATIEELENVEDYHDVEFILRKFIEFIDKILLLIQSENCLINQTKQVKVKEYERQVDNFFMGFMV